MKEIKPYGDTLNDGIIQLAFTLPIENSGRAKKAAEIYASKLNLEKVEVVHAKKIGENFTYFVVYARAIPVLDYDKIKVKELKITEMDFYQINEYIKTKIKRPITVVGATIGSDAHTVGIDAIMNMKGYNMNYGLERYPEINTYNLGAQVPCDQLFQKSMEVKADAILISQTVLQKDAHIANFNEFNNLLKKEKVRDKFILLAGGPRITNDFAEKIGYDAGFGAGTLPSQVASFIALKIFEKQEK